MISKIKKLAVKNEIFATIIYVCFKIYGGLFYIVFCVMDILPIKENKIVCCNMKASCIL